MVHGPPSSTLFPYTTLFRSLALPRARRPPGQDHAAERRRQLRLPQHAGARAPRVEEDLEDERCHLDAGDRKSTRLNSSHTVISYAVFCLKKKKYRTTESTGI